VRYVAFVIARKKRAAACASASLRALHNLTIIPIEIALVLHGAAERFVFPEHRHGNPRRMSRFPDRAAQVAAN